MARRCLVARARQVARWGPERCGSVLPVVPDKTLIVSDGETFIRLVRQAGRGSARLPWPSFLRVEALRLPPCAEWVSSPSAGWGSSPLSGSSAAWRRGASGRVGDPCAQERVGRAPSSRVPVLKTGTQCRRDELPQCFCPGGFWDLPGCRPSLRDGVSPVRPRKRMGRRSQNHQKFVFFAAPPGTRDETHHWTHPILADLRCDVVRWICRPA